MKNKYYYNISFHVCFFVVVARVHLAFINFFTLQSAFLHRLTMKPVFSQIAILSGSISCQPHFPMILESSPALLHSAPLNSVCAAWLSLSLSLFFFCVGSMISLSFLVYFLLWRCISSGFLKKVGQEVYFLSLKMLSFYSFMWLIVWVHAEI